MNDFCPLTHAIQRKEPTVMCEKIVTHALQALLKNVVKGNAAAQNSELVSRSLWVLSLLVTGTCYLFVAYSISTYLTYLSSTELSLDN